MKTQATLEAFQNSYSEALKKKVKEILDKRNKHFVDHYFIVYDKSEVVIDSFD